VHVYFILFARERQWKMQASITKLTSRRIVTYS